MAFRDDALASSTVIFRVLVFEAGRFAGSISRVDDTSLFFALIQRFTGSIRPTPIDYT